MKGHLNICVWILPKSEDFTTTTSWASLAMVGNIVSKVEKNPNQPNKKQLKQNNKQTPQSKTTPKENKPKLHFNLHRDNRGTSSETLLSYLNVLSNEPPITRLSGHVPLLISNLFSVAYCYSRLFLGSLFTLFWFAESDGRDYCDTRKEHLMKYQHCYINFNWGKWSIWVDFV